MAKKVLLTGASGFLGRRLVEKLLGDNWDILAISLEKVALDSKRLKSLECDLSDSKSIKIIRPLTQGIKYVIHAAAQMPKTRYDKDVLSFMNNNVNATFNLLKALPQNLKQFVYCSSIDVYGASGAILVKESNLAEPKTYYGLSKLLGEHLLKIHFQGTLTAVTSLRFVQLYGPQEPKIKIIPRLIDSFLTDKDITIENMGQDVRDYLFVEDAADAIIKSLNKPLNWTFNVSSQKGVTIRNVIKALERITGKRAKVNYLPVEKVSGYIFNSKKFRIAANWRPKVTFLEGLKRQYEFASRNFS